MKTAVVRSPAKLNLTFEILGLRPDGFHDVETIFQTISLEDELHVQLELSSERSFELRCENPYIRRLIPLDESNLIGRAFNIFMDTLRPDKQFAAKVDIEKKIPIGAGLAGGSGNAAGMLLALNELTGKPFSTDDLMALALKCGSDVPFCLQGGTSIGRGRGEILEPIDRKLDISFCIVKPLKLSVSTPWAFKAFDEYTGSIQKPAIQKVIDGLGRADLELTLQGLGNVFEPVILEAHEELVKLKNDLIAHSVFACHMTGSGPTLFAVVSGREMGHHIRRQMLRDDEIGFYYGTEDVILEAHPPIDFRLAETVSHGARIISMTELEHS